MFSVQAFIFLFIAVAEAIERLLIKRFFREECPREAYMEGIKALVDCDKDGTIEKNLMQLSEKYMIYKQGVCDGQMGITLQFWMIYLDLMEKQHHFHTAVQEGNFDWRICAWELLLFFYFSTNKHKYAGCGSWYVHQMRNRDSLHGGNKIIFSVQSQARYNLRTAVDQRREQSLNKDAKTVGVVRKLSPDNDAVTKWNMGSANQSRNLNTLLQMCNISQQYKHTWPSQVCRQNHARQLLLQFWRMTLPTPLILH